MYDEIYIYIYNLIIFYKHLNNINHFCNVRLQIYTLFLKIVKFVKTKNLSNNPTFHNLSSLPQNNTKRSPYYSNLPVKI